MTALTRDQRVMRQQVNAQNKTVTPGLVQAHTHLVQMFWRGRGEGKQLLEWLRDHTWPGEAALGNNPQAIATSAHYGAAELLRYGATTAIDMATVHGTLPYVRNGLIPTGLRVFTGNVVMDHMDAEVPFPKVLNESPDEAIANTRMTLQGIDQMRAQLGGRVHPAVTMRFLITSAPETAARLARLARLNNWVLQTHASENIEGEIKAIQRRFAGYNEQGLSWEGKPFETDNVALLYQLGFLGPRTFLEHVVHPTAAEFDLLRKTQTTVVHCPGSNGMLGSGVAPIAHFLERGIRVALGSDGAPCNDMLSMRHDMWAAKVLAGAHHQNSTNLSPQQIFDMATIGPLAGLGLEDSLGRLIPGYQADFVIWAPGLSDMAGLETERDTVGRLVRTTGEADDVFIEGQHVYRDGKPAFVGEMKSFETAVRRMAARIHEEAGHLRVPIPFLEPQRS